MDFRSTNAKNFYYTIQSQAFVNSPVSSPIAQNTVNITGMAGQTDSPGKPGQLFTNQSGNQGCKTSLKLWKKVKFQGIQIDNARGTNPIFTVRKKPTFSTDPQLSAQTVTRCCHTKSFLGKRQREGCTHHTEGCMCWRQRQKELPRVTHESLRRKNQEHLPLENQGRRRANRAIPTFTALFRLRSYQGLQEITYPLLQHYLKQTPYFINPYFSGLQESFPLGALG